MKRLLMIFLLVFVLAAIAQAQNATPRADTRETAQRARIREGRRDGEVTKGEAVALNSEQRRVKRSERRAKADGVVTPGEKVRIEKKQDRASRHIRRAKHNKVDHN